MLPWFEQYPQRLEFELQALRDAGYAFSLNEKEKEEGRIVLIVQYPIDGEIHDLTVMFPDLYPYFMFEIFGPTFPHGRHRDPYSGLLCTLSGPQQNWKTTDTLAGFLGTQVKNVVQVHRDPENAKALEAHEGAQATGYFRYKQMTVVFTGEWSIPAEYAYGKLIIGLEPDNDPNQALRGVVLEVLDAHGNSIARIDEAIANRHEVKLTGRWTRLSAPPSSANGEAILSEAIAIWSAIKTPHFKGGPDVVGLLFPEETDYQEYTENWVFVVRIKVPDRSGKIDGYLARADRFSPKNVQARVPRLSQLGNKNALVVGLGSIGSECAWQLARAGVGGLHLLDFDHVQLGNMPRWLLGFNAVGWPKAFAIANHIAGNYPFVSVKPFLHRIGAGNDRQVLPEALDGVDLIFDATAEWCVNQYLSDLAKQLGITYVWATGTPGSQGGIVGRVIPNRTPGCWKCFQRHLQEGTIPLPAQEDVPDVQPVGCFHPTFTGTGFDMDHVALAAVRLIVSTLCSSQEGTYPDFDWDVGVLKLWDKQGLPIAPQWSTHQLHRHMLCKDHV